MDAPALQQAMCLLQKSPLASLVQVVQGKAHQNNIKVILAAVAKV